MAKGESIQNSQPCYTGFVKLASSSAQHVCKACKQGHTLVVAVKLCLPVSQLLLSHVGHSAVNA